MRKPKLTDEQIVAVLREAERGEKTIIEICKKAGVTEQTFYPRFIPHQREIPGPIRVSGDSNLPLLPTPMRWQRR
jgi:hypothetical protein